MQDEDKYHDGYPPAEDHQPIMETLSRFDDENFGSDVYVTCERDVFVIRVASHRVPDPVRETLPPIVMGEGLAASLSARKAILLETERVAIGGPCDGAEFAETGVSACLERLGALRDALYRIPPRLTEYLEALAAVD